MNTVSAIALSGMRAAENQLGVAAHNIANLSSEGFSRQRADATTVAGGGVATSVGRSGTAGQAPESDLVASLQAKNAFLVNLAVFRSGDRTLGALLDTVG